EPIVQDTAMSGARLALENAPALERSNQRDERLWPYADFPCERGSREIGAVAHAEQHEKLRRRQVELGKRDLHAAAHRKLGALQEINSPDGPFVHASAFECW